MPPTVPSEGPLTARLLWVGEAPGPYEVTKGRPFIGASGQIVRRTLQWAGIDIERDVRFTNAVRHNPGNFPIGAKGMKLLAMYARELDAEIASMPNLQVIVACGGPAMTRLTSRRSKKGGGWGIERYQNFVFRPHEIPNSPLSPHTVVIPIFHPAGIMRSSGRDELINFRRGVQKVKAFLDNTASRVEFNEFFVPDVKEAERVIERALGTRCSQEDQTPNRPIRSEPQDNRALHTGQHRVVYFDTEFHRETKQVTWFGFTFDGVNIYGLPWHIDYIPSITRILYNDAFTKAAHNIKADFEALSLSGSDQSRLLRQPLFDTLIAHHTLHPALGVGLDDASRYYIDDLAQWKDLETSDPHYNAIDVAYGWRVMTEQLKEAAARPVDPLPELYARQRLIPIAYIMEKRGMHVDIACQQAMRADALKTVELLNEKIETKVSPIWDKRARGAVEKADQLMRSLEVRRATHFTTPCTKHPKRNGLTKPPKNCEVCAETYAKVEAEREQYKTDMKSKAKVKGEAERWGQGFKPTNNEHLRWLLYSPDALRLPLQYNTTNGGRRLTANRTAIDKLATLRYVQLRKQAFSIVIDIKEVQHLAKAISTFIDIPLDTHGVAHPPYKIQGTRTGRLAGGSDKDAKSDNTYAFNVLNIPREWRAMYVAPPGHILIAADWRNVEGRLTAMFCKDPYYTKVLREELTGGPKVHAVNAGIIYNIDPSDAHSHMISLSGQPRPAYDGGKRLTHAWAYGMQPPHMSRTFNITQKEAMEIDAKLSAAYPRLVHWRQKLVDDVLGVWEREPGTHRTRCVSEGRRFLANPFGWQFHFLGVGADQANEVIAFLPQSTGAGMFTRVGPLLEARYPLFTGTYDSFAMVVPATSTDVHEAITFLKETMEREWTELEGRAFPCEVESGYNWGKRSDANPRGMKEVA